MAGIQQPLAETWSLNPFHWRESQESMGIRWEGGLGGLPSSPVLQVMILEINSKLILKFEGIEKKIPRSYYRTEHCES